MAATTSRNEVVQILAGKFRRAHPRMNVCEQGYVDRAEDNLIDGVKMDDFEEDLRQGAGSELVAKEGEKPKFHAVHSSAALAVNCFAPFKRHLSDLRLCGETGLKQLQLEKQCPMGLRGIPPHLDLVVEKDDVVIAVESKFTEYIDGGKTAHFKESYRQEEKQQRWDKLWVEEMRHLTEDPKHYEYLDAAQLVKHAFGLCNTYPDKKVTLLYAYWEPVNAGEYQNFTQHRAEIKELSDRVAGAKPSFHAMSYTDLWQEWESGGAADWLREHIVQLRARYEVEV